MFVWKAVGLDGISLWLFLQLNTLPPGNRSPTDCNIDIVQHKYVVLKLR
jgi:hypothetical protein